MQSLSMKYIKALVLVLLFLFMCFKQFKIKNVEFLPSIRVVIIGDDNTQWFNSVYVCASHPS